MIPWPVVVFTYERVCLRAARCRSVGRCMNWLRVCTEQDRSGLVCVRKFSFPTRLRYTVGSDKGYTEQGTFKGRELELRWERSEHDFEILIGTVSDQLFCKFVLSEDNAFITITCLHAKEEVQRAKIFDAKSGLKVSFECVNNLRIGASDQNIVNINDKESSINVSPLNEEDIIML